ncbi:MAG: polysaccharide biosynthesis tyrosine autokinase [Bacteroidales bacterium]|nr:polysaccharide biosynthesis tyrosine autokinase [Bacteroidales bacterium]
MANNEYKEEDLEDNLLSFIDFRKLLSDIVHYWWLFVLTMAIVIVGLKYYHRYCPTIYSAYTTLIIDNSNESGSSAQMSLVSGVRLGQSMRNFDNQLAILGSKSLISRVVDNMGIYTSYFNVGRIKDTEIYPSNNYIIVMDSTHVQPIETRINFSPIDDKMFAIHVESEEANLYNYSIGEYINKIEHLNYDGKFYYGQPIVTPWCAFTLVAKEPLKGKIYAKFHDPEVITARFTGGLSIEHDTKTESSVVTLRVKGENSLKNIVFLNTLTQMYIDDNLSQKNLMSDNTIRFIDGQLAMLSDTMNRVEGELSSFRSNNGIQNDMSQKGKSILDELKTLDRQMQELVIEHNYYDYLCAYLDNDSILQSGDMAPATFNVQRPIINEQIKKLLELSAKRQVYRDTWGKQGNPMYDALDAELNIAKNTLLTTIESQKALCEKMQGDVQIQINDYNSQMMALPETERRLLGIDRKFTLNNDIFTFLMRKRSEAQIQRASNTSDHKLLDKACAAGIVSPNIKQNKMLGYAAAILLPLVLLVLRQVLDKKVRTVNDITKLTKYPLIGEVNNSKKETPLVVLNYPRSLISEDFRRTRIKLDFMTKTKDHTMIAITSAMPGDGKSFIAINIASVFAIAKKKTVLLGFDLRKPAINKTFDFKQELGITDYLIGNCKFEDIVYNYEGLDVISSGTIPPNPLEIIMSDECKAFLEEVKSRYDVIIVDTPPVGLVSDALPIANMVNATLFVVRQDYTNMNILQYALNTLNENEVGNVCLLMNDINSKKTRYGYGYGYGSYGKYGRYGKYGQSKYGYGYGYGSYDDDSKGYYTED